MADGLNKSSKQLLSLSTLKESVFNYFNLGKKVVDFSLSEIADPFHWLLVLIETSE